VDQTVQRRASTSEVATFALRHIGPSDDDLARMLARIGVADLDTLIDEAVPAGIRNSAPLAVPAPRSEAEVLDALRALGATNDAPRPLIGLGYHDTLTPAVIRRNVLEDPGWYTAYTPYQPEISQGRLEALLVFQTMVTDLAGRELAGASLLDEATAAAEALQMCRRVGVGDRPRVLVDHRCHPQTIAVVATRFAPLEVPVTVVDVRRAHADGTLDASDVCAVLLQSPDTDGVLHDDAAIIDALHAQGALVVVATDLLSTTLVVPPGEQGADAVVGSAQRFGVPMMFGGPHAAFLATRPEWARQLPGRLVGVSIDAKGRVANRLALQTREQHIRREKATSNICTSQVLLAVVAAMYGVHHGPDGLTAIATRVHARLRSLRRAVHALGITVVGERHFDTLTLEVPGRAGVVLDAVRAAGYELGRLPGPDGSLDPHDPDRVRIALDETTSQHDVERVVSALAAALVDAGVVATDTVELALAACADEASRTPPVGIEGAAVRATPFMTDQRFHRYRSETELMRWLRRLKDRDIALDRAMIPLGSCTMKLNAAVEMEAVTWPEFARLHPFARLDGARGTLAIVRDLEDWLAEVTGYDAVSLQPNAGSQGEFAGLLAIRGYHRARGEAHRDVCLIPSSAHGTNAASAVMAGMRVMVVACDEQGNVDVADLARLIGENAERLAALMITYPSTHGVFEAAIRDICAMVHDAGGQVYVDGANLNALVGLAAPGHFGADVSHLNLHKTFCIPHGGGGPGVGPVACGAHLAPYLPTHPLVPASWDPAAADVAKDARTGPVSGAAWGSAGILQIPWAYVALMGPGGLRDATRTAIVAANYVAARLGEAYPVLYTGEHGRVAHEVVLDLRGIRDTTGITNEDVAKRLVDFGFHAPTMSFPVAGTLMIEPTESESLAEIDRFCDAMLAIADEIARVAAGQWPADDNPLVNAPHTAEDVTVETWTHPYPRELAAFPVPGLRDTKYWPPVSRIDNAHGDRNLSCTCPPLSAFAEPVPEPVA